ncbi:MAG: hypothetical protein CMM49_03480 [Rhodospirillaceae bacterium]|nr:hypothetical protein [Rhodospirillaceae bacterium]|tara:strand:+ start:71954 stop:72331 length:378 start_codon:yes stop_codon:yes gene_type:complete
MSSNRNKKKYPLEISYSKKNKTLTVFFSNDENYKLSAEYLRISSPSAEVQTHNPQTRLFVPGKRYVDISNIEKVGNYAIRIVFNDGHDTGIYTWEYLYELGSDFEKNWNTYTKGLEKRNLSRELG